MYLYGPAAEDHMESLASTSARYMESPQLDTSDLDDFLVDHEVVDLALIARELTPFSSTSAVKAAATMATQTIDPRALHSWEDAFTSHPLPTVRRLETQLRRQLDENRDRLRGLVGTSYRSLLGTAERIVEMDAQVSSVEERLSSIGRRCNSRAVERKMENQMRLLLLGERHGVVKDGRATAAMIKMLQGLLGVAARLVRAGGDALLGAKLVVLARLLHKSAVEASDKAPAVLDELRARLGQVRKKLLGHIERGLSGKAIEREELVRTLCAYALVTSSGPKDLLRYFLQVRSRQLAALCEGDGEGGGGENDVAAALGLYGQTLTEVRAVFPRQLAEGMTALAREPLLADKRLRELPTFSLDVYEGLLPDSIRNFTPWAGHDRLTTADVGQATTGWSKRARELLLQGLRLHLRPQTDVERILDERTAHISQLATVAQRLRLDDHVETLHEVRGAFLARLLELATRAASADTVVEVIREIRSRDQDGDGKPSSLWDLSPEDFDGEGGVLELRKTVVRLHRGQADGRVQRLADVLSTWSTAVQTYLAGLKGMRSQRWEVDFELDLEDEGERRGQDSLRARLVKGDWEQLREAVRAAVSDGLDATYAALSGEDVSRRDQAETRKTTTTTTTIRMIRLVDSTRHELGTVVESRFEQAIDAGFVDGIHGELAAATVQPPMSTYSAAVAASPSSSTAAASSRLWEGAPALPVQPSVAAFRLVRDVQRQMAGASDDVWSPAAVAALKRTLADRLAAVATAMATTTSTGDQGGREGEGEDDKDDGRRTRLIQQAFDMLFVGRVISRPGPGDGDGDGVGVGIGIGLVERLMAQGEIDAAANERLRRSAEAYWRRSWLLFGLLAR